MGPSGPSFAAVFIGGTPPRHSSRHIARLVRGSRAFVFATGLFPLSFLFLFLEKDFISYEFNFILDGPEIG
jgi:hypothetical protein